MPAKPLRHYFPNGNLEIGTGRPGYRSVRAYSEALPGRSMSQPFIRADVWAMARRDGYRAVFHGSEDDARAALNATRGEGEADAV